MNSLGAHLRESCNSGGLDLFVSGYLVQVPKGEKIRSLHCGSVGEKAPSLKLGGLEGPAGALGFSSTMNRGGGPIQIIASYLTDADVVL